MSEELIATVSSLEEKSLRSWLTGSDVAASINQWIFWNNSPSRHIPLATLTQFLPEKFHQFFLKDLQVHSQIDAILRSKLSWTAPVAWNPKDPLWDIALIAPDRLKRFAFLAAALSMKDILTKIIDGAVVRKLRQEIGEDIMEFVLLSGSITKYFFDECVVGFPLIEDPIAGLKGRALLLVENAFSAKEVGIRQRIASKMPGTFVAGVQQVSSPLATKTEEMFCKLWKEVSLWL